MVAITVYTRAGCTLCAQAEQLVAALAAPGDRIELVDVDADAALTERYTVRVPVIAVDGVELFELQVDAEQLAGALAGARAQRSS